MTGHLQFDFVVDRDNRALRITRELAAPRQLVWDCYTKSELLDRWFSPKPLTTKTKHMDFREGGHWHYAMVDPGGTEYWGRTDYQTIRPIDFYSALDGFSDETGAVNPELPRSRWEVTFTERGAHTVVETVATYHSADEIDQVLQMGMKEGMTSTLERLDELLVALTA